MRRVTSGWAWAARVGAATLLAVPAWAPSTLHAQGPRVTLAEPSRVELATDGSAVEVMLEGEGLDAFTGGVFEAGGREVRGVRVEVSHGRDGRTRLRLEADPSAAGLEGGIVLVGRSTRFVVREVAVGVAAGFEPVVVSTGTLSMTGRRFEPVVVAPPPLSMVGRRFTPVTVAVPALSMTGRRDSRGGTR